MRPPPWGRDGVGAANVKNRNFDSSINIARPLSRCGLRSAREGHFEQTLGCLCFIPLIYTCYIHLSKQGICITVSILANDKKTGLTAGNLLQE